MIYYILLKVSIVFADQLTKWLAVISLKGEESFPFWEGVFHFTYVENTGSAFGMLKDHRWVFMSVSTVVIVAALLIFFIYYKKLTPLMRWAISFLVAGGIGNMIDRVFLGYVVDFLDFTLIDFAVFNVADSFVCIGAGLFVLWYVLDAVNEYKQKKTASLAKAEIDDVKEINDEKNINIGNSADEATSDIEENTETSAELSSVEDAKNEKAEQEKNEPSDGDDSESGKES